MPKNPEPKFVVKYAKNDLSIEEQERMYKIFIMHLVRMFKEQETLELKQKKLQKYL